MNDEHAVDYEIREIALDAAVKFCTPVSCGDADALIREARKIEAYLSGKAPDGNTVYVRPDGELTTHPGPWVGAAAALDS